MPNYFALNLTGPATDWRECRYLNGQQEVRPTLPRRLADKNRPIINGAGLFYRPAIDYIKSFAPSVIRFMDLQATNAYTPDSGLKRWEERTKPEEFQGDRDKGGMCYEYLLELAQEIGAVPWFCIPHQTYIHDPGFVQKFCDLIKENWKGKIILEFSNELWNFSPFFQQTRLAAKLGQEFNAKTKIRNPQAKGSSILQNDMAQKAKAALGDQVECVLAGWANNNKYNQLLLEYSDLSLFRYFATAPYYGSNVFPKDGSAPENKEEILRRLREGMDDRIGKFQETKSLLSGTALELIAYEGNHHMVDKFKSPDGRPLLRHVEASFYPEMREMTFVYLRRCRQINPDGFFAFFHAGPGKASASGSWAITGAFDEMTPIRQGIMDFLALGI